MKKLTSLIKTKVVFIMVMMTLNNFSYAQWEWVYEHEGILTVDEVAMDHLDNAYVSCKIKNNIDFGIGNPINVSGENDYLILKISSAGDLLWWILLSSEDVNHGNWSNLKIEYDVDNDYSLFVAGTFEGDELFIMSSENTFGLVQNEYEESEFSPFVCKIGNDATIKWAKSIVNERFDVGYQMYVNDIAVMGKDNVAVAIQHDTRDNRVYQHNNKYTSYYFSNMIINSTIEFFHPTDGTQLSKDVWYQNDGIDYCAMEEDENGAERDPICVNPEIEWYEDDLGYLDISKVESLIGIDGIEYEDEGYDLVPSVKKIEIKNIAFNGNPDILYVLGKLTYDEGLQLLYCSEIQVTPPHLVYRWTKLISNDIKDGLWAMDLKGNKEAAYAVFRSESSNITIENSQNYFVNNVGKPNSFVVKFDSENNGYPSRMLSTEVVGASPLAYGFSKISIAESKANPVFWLGGEYSNFQTIIRNHSWLNAPNFVASIDPIFQTDKAGIFLAKGDKNSFNITFTETFENLPDKESLLYDLEHNDQTLFLVGSGYQGMTFGNEDPPLALEINTDYSDFLAKRNTKDIPEEPDSDPSNPDDPGINVTISPNPTSASNINLTISATEAQSATLQIVDEISGAVMHQEGLSLTAGDNLITRSISSLIPGFYIVHVTGTTDMATERLEIR